MNARSRDNWSLTRSLALLSAAFAIVLGALLPTAVVASSGWEPSILLCSGERGVIFYDRDGTPRPAAPDAVDELKCIDCILSGMAALPPRDEVQARSWPRLQRVRSSLAPWLQIPPGSRFAFRPPSTAPPGF